MPGSPARPITPSEYKYDRSSEWNALEKERPRDAGGNPITNPKYLRDRDERWERPDLYEFAPPSPETRLIQAMLPELVEALRPVVVEAVEEALAEREIEA